jgi:hypothetical protein
MEKNQKTGHVIKNEQYLEASQIAEIIGDAERISRTLAEVLNRAKYRTDNFKENLKD